MNLHPHGGKPTFTIDDFEILARLYGHELLRLEPVHNPVEQLDRILLVGEGLQRRAVRAALIALLVDLVAEPPGVVAEGPQVARYGRMIDREGRRLTELVGQVLTFARMQSGTRFEPEPLDAAGVVSQVRHIFAAGVRFAQAHPDYISLYLNVSSAGMARFAQQMSREVEKFAADHLKRMLRRGIERGEVRADIDVNLTAFLINSLYIIFVSSLVSPHFRIRMREYLEIEGRLTDKAIQDQLERTMDLIGGLLSPEVSS